MLRSLYRPPRLLVRINDEKCGHKIRGMSNYSLSWIKQYPQLNTTTSESTPRVVSDSLGNLYVTYSTDGTVSGGSRNASNDIVVVKMAADGSILWIKQQPVMSTSESDILPEIAIDSAGNCYVSYTTPGLVSGGTNIGLADIVVFKLDTNGNLVWIKELATMNSPLGDAGPSIAADPSGNCYVVYDTFGAISGASNQGTGQDIVVFKLDTNGNLAWIIQHPNMSTNQVDYSSSIGVDSAGNSYVAFRTDGSVSGGGGQRGNGDIAVFKLSADGAFLWARQYNSMNTTSQDTRPSLATDSVGNSYISWQTTHGGLGFGIAVSKLDTNGNLLWVHRHGIMNTSSTDADSSIAVDIAGRIYITFRTDGTISGGTRAGPAGTNDIVVAILDNTSGNPLSIYQQSVMSSAGNDLAPYITTDSFGNCYVSYQTDGTVSGGINSGLSDIVVFKLARPPPNYSLSWIKQSPQVNARFNDSNPHIVSDSLGNLYITYQTDGTVSGGAKQGSLDIVVVKMGTDGTILWIKQPAAMSTFVNDTLPTIAIDSSGNCYVSYTTTGIVSGGTNIGPTDIVVFKMDTNGNLLWIKQLATMNTPLVDGNPTIAADPSGNCYVSYDTTGAISGASNQGSFDIVVIKLDTNGTLAWITQHPNISTTLSDNVPSIGADSSGNSYVAYRTSGSVSGGVQKGNNDIAVFKLSSSGTVLWVRQQDLMNTASAENSPSLAVDSAGNCYISHQSTNNGTNDIVVSKLDTNGAVVWVKKHGVINTGAPDEASSIAVDSAGKIYISYQTTGTVSGGTNMGSVDIVVVVLNTLGDVLSVKQQSVMSTTGSDVIPSITADSFGNCYVAYHTDGSVSGGINSGLTDIVVFKLAPAVSGLPTNYSLSWIKQHPQINTTTSEKSSHIVSDALGNLYLTYVTAGTVSGGTNKGSDDIVVVKMATDGNILWIKQQLVMNTVTIDATPKIAIDSAGNCFVAYSTGGTVSGGDDTQQSMDIVIFKLDTNGNLLWIKQSLTMNTLENDADPSIAVDLSGNCYGAYQTYGLVYGGVSEGPPDIVVFKMDTNGTLVWVKQQPPMSTDIDEYTPSIGVDSAGNSYIVYNTYGTVSGGTSSGGDLVVLKMDTNGSVVWVQQQAIMNTTNTDTNPSLAVDSAGSVYVTYQASATVSGGTRRGNSDIVVFKMDSNGQLLWIKQQSLMNTASGDTFPSIAVDKADRVYVSYITDGTVSGGTKLAGTDIVVLMMDTFGNVVSIYQQSVMSTMGSDTKPSITTDSLGNCFVSYQTGGAVSGGSNSGLTDIVVFKLAGPPLDYTVSWIKQDPKINTVTSQSDPNIVSDSFGNLYLTYTTNGTVSGGLSKDLRDVVVVKMAADSTILWIKQAPDFNTSSNEVSPRIAIDSVGSCYVTYRTNGTVSGGIAIGGANIIVFKLDTNGNILWIKQTAVMSTPLDDLRPSIAVDLSGNCYVSYDTVGATSGGSNQGSYDIVIFKMDTNGTLVWIQQHPTVSTSSFEIGPSIGVDKAGNSYVAYYTGGTVSGGTFIGGYDIVVFKMATDGQLLWIKQQRIMNSTAVDQYPSLAVDSAGSVYVAYHTSGTVSGGTFLGGFQDIVVFKMDTNGSIEWIKEQSLMNTSGQDIDHSIAVDKAGRVYVSYQTSGTVSGGTSAGSSDIVVFMMDVFGNVISVYQESVMSSAGSEVLPSIAVDSAGNCYVCYQTDGTVSGGTNAGNTDVVVFKMVPTVTQAQANYTVSWIKQYSQLNTSGNEQQPHIVSDALGNLYLTYQTSGTVSGGTLNGSNDIVVVKMDATGNILWIKQQLAMSTPASDIAPEIAIDSAGNCYVTYVTAGTVSGGTRLNSDDVAVFKMDTNGNLLWVKQMSTMNTPLGDGSPSIAADPSGNCYVSYDTTGAISGASNKGTNQDIVVFKMDTNGNLAWITQHPNISTTLGDNLPSIDVDKAGNSYVAYRTTGTVSGGTNAGGNDIVVFKLASNGQLLWIKQQRIMNSTGGENSPSLAVDSAGNSYVSYQTNGTISGGTFLGGSADIVIFKMDNNGQLLWIKQQSVINTTDSDFAPSIAVDSAGKIYVSYQSLGAVSGGTNKGNFDIVVLMMDIFGNVLSVNQQSVMSSTGSDTNTSITTDSAGNCYVSYHTSAAVSGGSNSGSNDIVVFKMTPYESDVVTNTSWIKQQALFNTTGNDTSPSLAVDSLGNSYVAYTTTGTVSGGTNIGGNDIVVLKMATDGQLLWIKQTGFSSAGDDITPSLAVDSAGNCYVCYRTGGTVSGGTNVGISSFDDIVIFKLDSNGQLLWIKQSDAFNSINSEASPSLAVDLLGNCYMAYHTNGAVSGGVFKGGIDIVVSKMDTNGNVIWLQQQSVMNSTLTDADPSIALDSSANIYVTYETTGTVSSGTLTAAYDIVVFKMDPNGTLQWIKQEATQNTTGSDRIPSIAVDSSGNSFVSYYTGGTVSGGTFLGALRDIVVFKMDTNGTLLWIKQQSVMASTMDEQDQDIAVDSAGNCYVSYSTYGTVSGGTSAGPQDIVILKMDTNGNILWVTQEPVLNTSGANLIPSIALDASNNIYVSYQTTGTVSGGTSMGATDIVVMKIPQYPILVTTQISGGISASWADSAVGVPFTSYRVLLYANLAGGLITSESVPLRTIETSSYSAFFAGLIYGTLYTISLSGYNGSAYLPVSVSSCRLAPVPSPPRNITVSAQESKAIVSWADPLDAGVGDITKYTVTSDNSVRAVAVSGNTAVVSGLTPGSSHRFSVYAENSYGTTSATADSAVVPTTPVQIPPVPFPDCTPWAWFDASDPTSIASTGDSLGTWQNKGTAGSSASPVLANTVLTGVDTINNRNVVTLTSGASLSIPSLTPLSNSSFVGFFVVRPTTDIGATGGAYNFLGGRVNNLGLYCGVDSVSNSTSAIKTAVIYGVGSADLTVANVPNQYYETGLYSYVQTGAAANNFVGFNGSDLTKNLSATTTAVVGTRTYEIGSSVHQTSLQYAEAVVFSGTITLTLRKQIEGYLAWKWGLQAQLPAGHPYSLANYKETVPAFLRPRSFVTTFAGSGVAGSTNGTGTGAQFNGPDSLVEDSQGNIFVTENSGQTIRKITPAGVVTTFVGFIQYPLGITIDSDNNLYVATQPSIRKITPSGTVTVLAGGTNGDAVGTLATASFSVPNGITFDLSGNLYVCDTNKIKKISIAQDSVTVFAGPAAGDASTGDVVGTGNTVRFDGLRGIACDSNGNLFVCDSNNNKIKKITPAGVVSVFAGPQAGTNINGTVDGLGTDVRLKLPHGILIDKATNYIYVAESGSDRIRRISPYGIVTTCVGPGPGVSYTESVTNGIDTVARFFNPHGLILAKDGSIYVAEFSANVIRKISVGANNQVGTYLTGLTTPEGIVLDRNGTLYIAETSGIKITKITQHGVKSDFAGSGVSGFADGLGTAATFQAPRCLVLDNYDNVYVSDSSNRNIRKITKAGIVTTFAGHVGIGTSGNYYLDATGTAARFDAPYALTIDTYGNIYVGDLGNGTGNNNRRIRKITPKGIVTTVAGSGLTGSTDGIRLNATLGNLLGITADALDNLLLCDSRRIRKINDKGIVVSIVGNNTLGSTDGTGSAASFNNTSGGAFDQYGNLYITDTTTDLVRKITPEGAVTRIAGGTVGGASDGIGSAASFNDPSQLCYDSYNSCLYVSDKANSTIRGIKIYPRDPVPYTNNSHTTFKGLSNTPFLDIQGQITFIPRNPQ